MTHNEGTNPLDRVGQADTVDMRARVSNLLLRSALNRSRTRVFQSAFEQQFGEFRGILSADEPNPSFDTLLPMNHDQRLDQVENQMIDMRLAISALLEAVNLHQAYHETTQQNFGTVMSELRDIRLDMRDMQSDIRTMQSDIRTMQSDIHTMQLEIRGLQTENHRILEFLEGRFRDE